MSKEVDLDLLNKLDAAASETQEGKTTKLESNRRPIIAKFTEEAEAEEVKQEEEEERTPKRGPKPIYKMRSASMNFEKSVLDAVDDYCEENMLKRSEFVREILKEHMEGLGYRFSIDDLRHGNFEK